MTESGTPRIILTLPQTEITSRDGTPKYLYERDGLTKLVDEFCSKNGLPQTTERRMVSSGTIMSVRWVGRGDGIFYVVGGEQKENRMFGGDEPTAGVYRDDNYHFEGEYDGKPIKLRAEVSEVLSNQFFPERVELSSRRDDKQPEYWFVRR